MLEVIMKNDGFYAGTSLLPQSPCVNISAAFSDEAYALTSFLTTHKRVKVMFDKCTMLFCIADVLNPTDKLKISRTHESCKVLDSFISYDFDVVNLRSIDRVFVDDIMDTKINLFGVLDVKDEDLNGELWNVIPEFLHFLRNYTNEKKIYITPIRRPVKGIAIMGTKDSKMKYFVPYYQKSRVAYITSVVLNQFFRPIHGVRIHEAVKEENMEQKKCTCENGGCNSHMSKETEIMRALAVLKEECEHNKCGPQCPLAIKWVGPGDDPNGPSKETWRCGLQTIVPSDFKIQSPEDWRALG